MGNFERKEHQQLFLEMKENGKHILETNSLEIGYKRRRELHSVLKDINLSLQLGELVCFLGPNGVGKSTLLKTMAGIQRPLAGQVVVDGQPLSNLTLNEKAKYISLVLTGRTGGNLTVRELVSLGRHPHTHWSGKLDAEDILKIENAIENTQIEALQHRKLYTLSDGQMQKAMIARALAQDSAIMILDEPTAHLDLNNRMEIMDLLQKMAKETNKAILAATHELDLALHTADKLWVASFKNPIIAGVPEDLILNGTIERTFIREDTTFNPFSGSFSLNRPMKAYGVQLTGDTLARQWTRHALHRMGTPVSETEGVLHIDVQENGGAISWTLKSPEGVESYHSIEALLVAIGEKLPLH